MTDYLQGIITGFTAGIGTGIANWMIIKRLEHLERIMLNKSKKDKEEIK